MTKFCYACYDPIEFEHKTIYIDGVAIHFHLDCAVESRPDVIDLEDVE